MDCECKVRLENYFTKILPITDIRPDHMTAGQDPEKGIEFCDCNPKITTTNNIKRHRQQHVPTKWWKCDCQFNQQRTLVHFFE